VRAWRRGRARLVLGAGASRDYGLPTWTGLVERLARRLLGPRSRRVIRSIGDPQTVVEGLRHGVSTHDWETALSDALYGGSRTRGAASCWQMEPLGPVASVAALLAREAPTDPYHVLTFNLDTVFEEVLSTCGCRAVAFTGDPDDRVQTWEARARGPLLLEGLRTRTVEVRVWHPHGIVPPSEDSEHRCSRRHVLSSADYDRVWTEPLGRESLGQTILYSQHTALMYGLSFSDPLLRAPLSLGRAFPPMGLAPAWRHLALISPRGEEGRLTVMRAAQFQSRMGLEPVFLDFQQMLSFMLTLHRRMSAAPV
jgi:hypothetical protein